MVERLRDKKHGCPWDLKQTFASIACYTLEEASEVVQAIEQKDFCNLKEELGDLLFQIIFHTEMAKEEGLFNLSEVCDDVVDKMVRRHPHVFPEGHFEPLSSVNSDNPSSLRSPQAVTPEQVEQKWQEIKEEEKKQHGKKGESAMPDDLPALLPTLLRAEKIQTAAAQVGFDWTEPTPVFEKINEELNEVLEAIEESSDRVLDEVGDLLFSCVNLARHLNINPEMALRRSCHKFDGRFRKMETLMSENDHHFEQLTLEEMEAYWQQCKLVTES